MFWMTFHSSLGLNMIFKVTISNLTKSNFETKNNLFVAEDDFRMFNSTIKESGITLIPSSERDSESRTPPLSDPSPNNTSFTRSLPYTLLFVPRSSNPGSFRSKITFFFYQWFTFLTWEHSVCFVFRSCQPNQSSSHQGESVLCRSEMEYTRKNSLPPLVSDSSVWRTSWL